MNRNRQVIVMLRHFLTRRRVALGFVLAAAVLYFAQPTWRWLAIGAAVAAAGQAIRVWAAGHLEKSREVTTSGPYQYSRHPLYLGSSIMALGAAIGCRSPVVAALVGLYMAATITAAIRSEEAFLRQRFGDAYDDYARSRGPRVARRFSWERAWRNREYRSVGGLLLFLGILAARVAWR
jgi:protein-S-isoprenylcysteine O-methyltransferase Ste14